MAIRGRGEANSKRFAIGHYEPVEEISKILDEYEANTGIDIPIHVDAASGGFVAPFTYAQAGGPKWSVHPARLQLFFMATLGAMSNL